MDSRRHFEKLSNEKRIEWLKEHRGFITAVVTRLRDQGAGVTKATVSRTWHGLFRTPNDRVALALDREYLKLITTPGRRRLSVQGAVIA